MEAGYPAYVRSGPDAAPASALSIENLSGRGKDLTHFICLSSISGVRPPVKITETKVYDED
jgi:hypothetical protein